jgi:hypothetical protein
MTIPTITFYASIKAMFPLPSQVVTELCRLEGATLYPIIINYLSASFDDPRLLEITDEDLAIYNTPEGKLFHQHLVDE